MDTRRYAKRQVTWFRNQMKDWPDYRGCDCCNIKSIRELKSENNNPV